MKQIKLMSKFGLALIAITAISVALGVQASYNIQTADAQARLPNNSVRTENIVNGQVQTDDLANGAVTTAKIADGTIQEQDIADGVIPSSGTQPRLYIVSETFDVPAGDPSNSFQVFCEEGDHVTGGGFGNSNTNIIVVGNVPATDGSAWIVSVNAATLTFDALLGVDAICLDLTP